MLIESRIAANYQGEAKSDGGHNWAEAATVRLAGNALINDLHADYKGLLSLWKFK